MYTVCATNNEFIGGESHSLLSRVQLEGPFPHLRLTDGEVR
jgi:hypothetical protein